jgi:hypothetical protein
MKRFNMSPREEHLKATKRILAYLKRLPMGRVIVDTSGPIHSSYIEDHPNCKDLKGPKVRMTVYVDADHTHDLITRRSITGVHFLLKNTLIRWVSNFQKTVETSSNGSELVASINAIELILEVRFTLRSSGVDLDEPNSRLGENISVVLNTLVPSIVLKKK